MPAITIELDEETLERVRAAAEQEGVSVDQIVHAAVGQYVAPCAPADRVRAATADVLSHYAPLLRRLAE